MVASLAEEIHAPIPFKVAMAILKPVNEPGPDEVSHSLTSPTESRWLFNKESSSQISLSQ